jgi:UDP:flavonoid glycosyltransferase YjiC (YdhE family)
MLPFAVGSNLAHLGACLAVAEELRGRGHEAVFGYGGALPGVIERAGFAWHPVPEVPNIWDAGRWFPTDEDLEAAVRAHVDLIERLAPDAAIVDSSAPARIACDAVGLGDVSIHHWLTSTRQYRRRRDSWGRRARLMVRPRRALAAARVRFGREAGALPGAGGPDGTGPAVLLQRINSVRSSLGLSPVASIVTDAWCGKVTACTTTPFLDPARRLPSNAHYVGPLTWSGTRKGPSPHRGERPLVFVSQGSWGNGGYLRRTVEELASEPIDVAVVTSELCDPEELSAVAPNVIASRYPPVRSWLKAADAAVTHGGMMTAGEVHHAGTPVAVLPSAEDHLVAAARVERLGVGISLWPPPPPGGIARAVRLLLSRPRYRRRATRIAERLRNEGWDGGSRAADLAEELTGHPDSA